MLPWNGGTHGGAYDSGTFTLPVRVSQLGPQSIFASREKSGGSPLRCAVAFTVDDFLLLPPPIVATTAATTAMTTTTASTGT